MAGAVSYYAQCSDSGEKSRCQQLAKAKAGRAAQAAAKKGDCNQVKIIARAAEAMGAGSGMLNRAKDECK